VILAERDRLEAEEISGNQTVRNMVSVLVSARVTENILVAERAGNGIPTQHPWFSGRILGCHSATDRLGAIQSVIRSSLPTAHHGIMVCPMVPPDLTQSLVVEMLQGFWRSRKNLIIPVYAGHRGYPLIIGEPMYEKMEEVSSLESLAESNADEMHEVKFPEAHLLNSQVPASRGSFGVHR